MYKDVLLRNNVRVEGNFQSMQVLVFAHGFGTDQTSWDQVKTAFAKDFKIVSYDQVGAGGSDFGAYSFAKYSSLEGYANDLLEICEALQLSSPVFIGHSVSSAIGLLAVHQRPKLFSKMVLLTPSPRYLNDQDYIGGFIQEELDLVYQSVEANYYEWISGFSQLAMGNPHQPGLANRFAETLSELRPDLALHVIRTIFQSDIRSILPEIDQQILILQAKNDIAVAPEVGPYLQKRLKNSDLLTIDVDGHFPHVSAASQVITAIRNFIIQPA